ncbi:MAG: TatD family hydrolase [Bacilli bacterium]|nr:TatD family hydrolase [Bacilli bacterium]
MYIDTHCHLSKEDYDDIDEVILNNRVNGIEKIIISGCTKDSIKESIELSLKYDDVFLTIGFHPSEADVVTKEDILFLEKNLKQKKVVGIGEIGLDYHYGKENLEKQKELFILQMRLASKYQLPVIIHSRDAFLDTITILKQFPNVVGDIHCFSGSLECAREYLSIGYYLGIGGVLTFKNSKLSSVVEKIGLDHILLETDSPYLTPEPYRGKKNSSKYIPYVAEKVGEILNVKKEEVALKTTLNANRLFDFH